MSVGRLFLFVFPSRIFNWKRSGSHYAQRFSALRSGGFTSLNFRLSQDLTSTHNV